MHTPTITITRRLRRKAPETMPAIEREMRACRALANANFERRPPPPSETDTDLEQALVVLARLAKE